MQIVTTHKNTDFDAFASVIAATLFSECPGGPRKTTPTSRPSVITRAFCTVADVDLKAVAG
jgi:hypothetical protein